MKSIPEIVDLASAYYGSAVLFAAIDCDVFGQIARSEFDASSRGMRLLADACVACPPAVPVIAAVFLTGGLIMLLLGIMGEYLARTYIQGKHRPVYIIKDILKGDHNG